MKSASSSALRHIHGYLPSISLVYSVTPVPEVLSDYVAKRKNRYRYGEIPGDGKYTGYRYGEIPGDGKYTWTKGRVDGGVVYGVKESDGDYHFEVCYDEGPKDKAFMEEGDWEYIRGLIHDGTLLEKEPNADKEIAPDHKYRAEITRALSKARAPEEAKYYVAVEQLEVTEKDAGKGKLRAKAALVAAESSGFFGRRKKVEKAQGDVGRVEIMWAGKIKVAKEAVAKARERAEKECSEREARERPEKERKEAPNKILTGRDETQKYHDEASQIVNDVRGRMATTALLANAARAAASRVKDVDIDTLIGIIDVEEKACREQFEKVAAPLQKIKAQVDRAETAFIGLRKYEIAGDDLKIDIIGLGTAAMQAASEAKAANEEIKKAAAEIGKRCTVIIDKKEKVIEIMPVLVAKRCSEPSVPSSRDGDRYLEEVESDDGRDWQSADGGVSEKGRAKSVSSAQLLAIHGVFASSTSERSTSRAEAASKSSDTKTSRSHHS